MSTFHIVVRDVIGGASVPVGLDESGNVCYTRSWQDAMRFADLKSAHRFRALVTREGLPRYADMLGGYSVKEHEA